MTILAAAHLLQCDDLGCPSTAAQWAVSAFFVAPIAFVAVGLVWTLELARHGIDEHPIRSRGWRWAWRFGWYAIWTVVYCQSASRPGSARRTPTGSPATSS